MLARGSHSFTCHSCTNHTCLYSPATAHHCPLAGTHCAYPLRDGQAELTWLAGYILRLVSRTRSWSLDRSPIPVLTGPGVESLIETNALPLSQTATRITFFAHVALTLTQWPLLYELDLDIMKTYLHTKNEVSRSRLSEVRTWPGQTDRHTHTQTDTTERTTSHTCGWW